MTTQNKLHFETLQLHVGQEQADPATDSRAVPIYQTTSYVFHSAQHASDRFHLKDAGNIYGRLTNTTQDVFEKRIAALEGGIAALAVASGAAALTYAITALARQGDHVVAQRTIYGGTYNLLQHTLRPFGVDTTFVNTRDLKEVEGAIKLLICSSVAFFFGTLTRLAISRRREYVADAGGAELCGNPVALASALRKISSAPGLGQVRREDVAQLYIVHPDEEDDGGLTGLVAKVNLVFCTHPDTPERIRLLEQF